MVNAEAKGPSLTDDKWIMKSLAQFVMRSPDAANTPRNRFSQPASKCGFDLQTANTQCPRQENSVDASQADRNLRSGRSATSFGRPPLCGSFCQVMIV